MGERLLLIDSGIGGLSLFNKALSSRTQLDLAYIADNKEFPYGVKDDETLKQIVKRLLDYGIQSGYTNIVLACNTASVIFKQSLEWGYPMVHPIIDHTAMMAIKKSKTKRIGIIATKKTIESKAYERELKSLDSGAILYPLEAQDLVDACEHDDLNQIKAQLDQIIPYFVNADIDVFILGCTHFNRLAPFIEPYFNKGIELILSGMDLIETLIKTMEFTNHQTSLYLTSDDSSYRERCRYFLEDRFKEVTINYINI
jgi:glutamate racemase